MVNKKRRRSLPPPTIHPRNRYAEAPPDFGLLASLYPSFAPFVFTSSSTGRPAIDWTDFNATRELTRVLLLHDHSVKWWIPDGQLCPTVPNRSNYIHWIEGLLSSEIIPRRQDVVGATIRGFDVGTGANCIYPLLGASLLGWSFVGSDVTDVALEWARKNVESNPHLSTLIEIRDARDASEDMDNIFEHGVLEENTTDKGRSSHDGASILVGVVKEAEYFDFCMCNPPFFESMEEAGLNPKTSCGGTYAEMVCPGGEQAFISRIIDDSVILKDSFRWFTSMVGRKANLKFLESKLREVGVSIVKTTEFVQGRTARWGLGWSFVSPNKQLITSKIPKLNNGTFTLQGLQRRCGSFQVLKSVESFFSAIGAICRSDHSTFNVYVTLTKSSIETLLGNYPEKFNGTAASLSAKEPSPKKDSSDDLSLHVSVFEQIPGTVLVKGSLLQKETSFSGIFSSLFCQLEETLKKELLVKPQ